MKYFAYIIPIGLLFLLFLYFLIGLSHVFKHRSNEWQIPIIIDVTRKKYYYTKEQYLNHHFNSNAAQKLKDHIERINRNIENNYDLKDEKQAKFVKKKLKKVARLYFERNTKTYNYKRNYPNRKFFLSYSEACYLLGIKPVV